MLPLKYQESEEDVGEMLIEGGGGFGSLKGVGHKYYKGLAFFKRKRGVARVNVNGRMILWLIRARLEGSIPITG